MKNIFLILFAMFALCIASCGKKEVVKMCKECGALPGDIESNGFCEACFKAAKEKEVAARLQNRTGGGMRANPQSVSAGEKFAAERLQIGMEVPDIEGEDVDGVNFKLSDYRGKVVVLDFWGDW